MKTVFLIVPSLGIGGQEQIAVNTAQCLLNEYDVKIVMFQSKTVEYSSPCEVINLNLPAGSSPIGKVLTQIKRAGRLAGLRKRHKPNIVYSFGTTANLTNTLSSPAFGKTVISFHGFAEIHKSGMMRFMLKHADITICVAKEMHRHLLALYPKSKNTIVIENGYDMQAIADRSKQEAPVMNGFPNFVSMGRLEKVKGFERLIDAFARVHKKLPNAHLSIIGDGSLRESLKQKAEDFQVSEFVTFTGSLKNPFPYIKKADIFVLSSYNEGFPNSLIEALSCGLPVIAADCPSGPREILSDPYLTEPIKGVKPEKYGVLVESRADDAEAAALLAEAMVQLSENPIRQEEYRQAGMERAAAFSLQVYRHKLNALFDCPD